jgi:hypothetical protein
MATETEPLNRSFPAVSGTVATETGGTMATEMPRPDWHYITEMPGTMATELSILIIGRL